jgi:hypothetical protein
VQDVITKMTLYMDLRDWQRLIAEVLAVVSARRGRGGGASGLWMDDQLPLVRLPYWRLAMSVAYISVWVLGGNMFSNWVAYECALGISWVLAGHVPHLAKNNSPRPHFVIHPSYAQIKRVQRTARLWC